MSSWYRFSTLLLVISCFVFGVSAQDDIIVVDTTQIVAEVSPFVYGANFGPLSVVPIDLFEQAAESGITFLRFPGGRWGDLNDITEFQIDQYMRIVRLIGATPSIHVRLENGTPEAAIALMRYANVENDYNIRHWYIGNEPNLFDDYTVDDHAQQWRLIAEAMKSEDPDIILFGPGVSQWNGTPTVDPTDPNGEDWLRSFLQDNGDFVDVIEVHRYPFPQSQSNPDTSIDDLRGNTAEWANTLENLRQVILEETGHDDIPVAMGEANSHWSANVQSEATPDSHANALWWATALGHLLMDDPYMVSYFELQTPTSRGAWGLLGSYTLNPTYYVYQLYKQFGSQVIMTESPIEHVNVFGALTDEGALTLIAVNFTDSDITAPIRINGFEGDVVSTRLLTEDVLAEEVEQMLLQDNQLTLPAMSAVLFRLE